MAGESCSHNCSGCGEDCGDREQESLFEKLNSHSSVKKVIGVVSGKGGVGKSLVTSLLAVAAQKKGLRAAIMDADITGPSIPKSFGIHEKARASQMGMMPALSSNGIQIMSLNLIAENETDPVIWRGPVIAGVVKQFWTDVVWKDVDIMFIDMDYMRAQLLSFFASHLSVELYYVTCKRIYFGFVFHSSCIKFYFVNHDTVISFEFRFGKRNL